MKTFEIGKSTKTGRSRFYQEADIFKIDIRKEMFKSVIIRSYLFIQL